MSTAAMPPPQRGARVHFVQHEGSPILMIDLSRLADATAIQAEIRTARDLLARQPAGTLRTLTLVDGPRWSPGVARALIRFALRERTAPRAAAVVGIRGAPRLLCRTLARVARRRLEVFEDAPAAMAWLVAQP